MHRPQGLSILGVMTGSKAVHWSMIAAVACAIGASWSVRLGQDVNYDLLNYHLYNPFALLNARSDFAPGAFHSFFYPYPDVPYYLLATSILSDCPRAVAAIQGLHFSALIIAVCYFNRAFFNWPEALLATVIGSSGAAALSEIGTTFNDLPVATLVLVGAGILARPRSGITHIVIGGVLAGLAAAIKMYAIYFIAAIAVSALISGRKQTSPKSVIIFVVISAVTFVATYLPWGVHLYHQTGNPIFPYANAIFKSPLSPIENFNPNFPSSIWKIVFLPLEITRRNFSFVTELEMRDPRFLAGTLSIVIMIVSWIRRRPLPHSRFLVATAVLCYAFWISQFRIYRYAIFLEALSGSLIVAAGRSFWNDFYAPRYAAASTIAGLIIAWTVVPDWGRVPFGSKVIEVRAPSPPPNSLIVVSVMPATFVLPFIGSNDVLFVGDTWLNRLSRAANERAKQIVANHSGPIFVMRLPGVAVKPYDLFLGTCDAIISNISQPLELCAATRD